MALRPRGHRCRPGLALPVAALFVLTITVPGLLAQAPQPAPKPRPANAPAAKAGAAAGPGGRARTEALRRRFLSRAARGRALRVDDDAREDRLRRPAVLQAAAGPARRRRGVRVLRRRERAEGRLDRDARQPDGTDHRDQHRGRLQAVRAPAPGDDAQVDGHGVRAAGDADVDRVRHRQPVDVRAAGRHQGPREVRRWRRLTCILLVASAAWPAIAQAPAPVDTFDAAWKIVRDTHFDPKMNGVDWDAVRTELRP